MTHCYVTAENCVHQAVKPLGEGWHKHGDYTPWRYGKRETLAIINGSEWAWKRRMARKVWEFLDWGPALVKFDTAMAAQTERQVVGQ
jgi:hypothetical protein